MYILYVYQLTCTLAFCLANRYLLSTYVSSMCSAQNQLKCRYITRSGKKIKFGPFLFPFPLRRPSGEGIWLPSPSSSPHYFLPYQLNGDPPPKGENKQLYTPLLLYSQDLLPVFLLLSAVLASSLMNQGYISWPTRNEF